MAGVRAADEQAQVAAYVARRSLHFESCESWSRRRASRLAEFAAKWLAEEGVDPLVGDVFFVVEGTDVGGHEGFDAVSKASGGFGEGHPGA